MAAVHGQQQLEAVEVGRVELAGDMLVEIDAAPPCRVARAPVRLPAHMVVDGAGGIGGDALAQPPRRQAGGTPRRRWGSGRYFPCRRKGRDTSAGRIPCAVSSI